MSFSDILSSAGHPHAGHYVRVFLEEGRPWAWQVFKEYRLLDQGESFSERKAWEDGKAAAELLAERLTPKATQPQEGKP